MDAKIVQISKVCVVGFVAGGIKAKWGPVYKVFLYENGLKFSKKIGIFRK